MTVKHTPGPWFAERTRLDGHEWFVRSECRNLPPYNWMPRFDAKLNALYPLHGRRYVDTRSGSGSDDVGCCPTAIIENEANAYLIAAAPDMLIALFEAQAELHQVPPESDEQALVLGIVRAAIAKAEGRLLSPEPPASSKEEGE